MSRDNLAADIGSVRPFGGAAGLAAAYRRPPGPEIIKPAIVVPAQPVQPTQRTVSPVGHSRATRHANDGDGEGDADPPPIRKAPMRETSAPSSKFSQQKQGRNHSAKSCAVEAQHDRILEALRRRPHTTQDLRCLVGVFQVSTRVKELRELGWKIETHRVNLVDSYGFFHPRCALYSLEEAAQ